jgi:hypothetical protein
MRQHEWPHLSKYRIVKTNVERLDLGDVRPGSYIAEPMIVVEAIDENAEVVARGIGADAYEAVNDLANRIPRKSFKSQPEDGTS